MVIINRSQQSDATVLFWVGVALGSTKAVDASFGSIHHDGFVIANEFNGRFVVVDAEDWQEYLAEGPRDISDIKPEVL